MSGARQTREDGFPEKGSLTISIPQNPVLCGLGNPKFDYGLGWNLDLLLRLWIKTSLFPPPPFREFMLAIESDTRSSPRQSPGPPLGRFAQT
jgi:hypothetical protein